MRKAGVLPRTGGSSLRCHVSHGVFTRFEVSEIAALANLEVGIRRGQRHSEGVDTGGDERRLPR
ncbi:hypothetical protein NITHO_3360006 [Nitrolancea hollandica Lb]|uniref:Uncharacterized protein n=1 Tax=Nitrolancea hollandica Lb TaxID=1129897 RepID=I4EI77_9BACT|nr:hypothetical protein NITHO_3360006 [Nitrolancea hollandica Lb]